MKTPLATRDDFENWLELAKEVEHLFGPMTGEESFHQALRLAFDSGNALCVRDCGGGPGSRLSGGIVVSPEENRIEWLAVAEDSRGRGIGKVLLEAAIRELDAGRSISVQTFAPGVPEGLAARRLYRSFGFEDRAPADPTPAGVPTVVMVRSASSG